MDYFRISIKRGSCVSFLYIYMGSYTKYQVITDYYNMVLIVMVATIMIPDQPKALGNGVISLGYTQAAYVQQATIFM